MPASADIRPQARREPRTTKVRLIDLRGIIFAMRRLLRWTFNGVAAVSAVLLLLQAGFWAGSFRVTYTIPFTWHGSRWVATCKEGKLAASNDAQRALEARDHDDKFRQVSGKWNSLQQDLSRLIEARMRERRGESYYGRGVLSQWA
jgi:hypothetical protein